MADGRATSLSPAAIPATRAAALGAELRRLILSGDLPVGTRLRQIEISERFGVSTTPVREAFTMLAREGLLQQDAHRGVKVILPSQADLRENYEIRSVLEPMATEHAATRIGKTGIDALKDQVDRMVTAYEPSRPTGDETQRADANREFHRIIYNAADRPKLAELIEQLRNSADVYHQITVTEPPPAYRKRAIREHRAIIKFLTARDGARAAEQMQAHLQHNFEHLSKTLSDLTAQEPLSGRS
ncbi:GntR family transcriptional regulator [Amycolatopsis jejuensis]|uniref:GntR family transcriptional regulator n=1 Tax=Amycolatopsis jejuensis TaxID=330084 RepID=UPI000526FBB9|nr:GntR family transcriptional regulator [Amycolatopsis jejuensis]